MTVTVGLPVVVLCSVCFQLVFAVAVLVPELITAHRRKIGSS
jgi:hypothetical protein